MTAKQIEQSGQKAIKKLRRQKLRQGLPFMINSDILDSDQCFLEFPDGIIRIAEAAARERDFQIVFEYSLKDSDRLRRQFNLI